MSRLWIVLMGALVALVMVLAAAAAPDRKPPRLVVAAMIDADNDARADRVRLTYSERVRHGADRDGRYPFTVSGYRVLSVGKASGKALVLLLAEHPEPDPAGAPTVRYRRTPNQPVKDRAGNQALAQQFARVKAHGHEPDSPPPPPPAPAPLDADGDGTPDADDCAPKNSSIHPGAADTPDLAFVDSNCDGIDGTEKDAIFAAPNGNDANPGTKAKPKREVQAAVDTARAGNGRYVLVAFGTYARVKVASGIGIFGGYDATSWQRRDRYPDGLPVISGSPEGVLADGAKDVVLQHLKIQGAAGASERSAYGIRAIKGAGLTLQRVVATAGNGTAGVAGLTGQNGARGGAGQPGDGAVCDDSSQTNHGGKGGSSAAGRTGGTGGHGGFSVTLNTQDGDPGDPGQIGTPGGVGGKKGNPGKPGAKGGSGENGSAGAPGAGGTSLAADAEAWVGQSGRDGGVGTPGNGGGGGGGGGPQVGLFAQNSDGNAGGGGGGGGATGGKGAGGGFGGGSFGLYLFDSKVVVEDSAITAGNGGVGGRGGSGGFGGPGGIGGKGGKVCTSEVGAGGDGGFGGAGGRGGGGGGGAGGPSVGVFKNGASTTTLKGTNKITNGNPGVGGAGGSSGPGGTGLAGASGIVKAVFP